MEEIVSESHTKNPKRFWAYIKSKGQEMMGVAPLKTASYAVTRKAKPVY